MTKESATKVENMEWLDGHYTGEVSDGVPHGRGEFDRNKPVEYRPGWKGSEIDDADEYRPQLPDDLQFIAPADGLSSDMVLKVLNRLGCQTITGYFSTECSSFATLNPADLNDSEYRSLFADSTVLPIGGGLQTTEAYIHDAKGSPVQDRKLGELVIRGHTVMQRYVEDESGTGTAFRNGWLHTGRKGFKITLDENNVKFFLKN